MWGRRDLVAAVLVQLGQRPRGTRRSRAQALPTERIQRVQPARQIRLNAQHDVRVRRVRLPVSV